MIELTKHLIERTALLEWRSLPHFGFGPSLPDRTNRDAVSRERAAFAVTPCNEL